MRTRTALIAVLAAALAGGATPAAQAMPGAPDAAPPTVLTAGFDFTRPQVVASNLAIPWGLAFLPDGSALVTERGTARLLQIRPGSPPTTLGTIPGVVPAGESGLLGVAVSPTFASDRFVYVYFTAAADNRITRFRLETPQSQQVVRSGIPKASIHDGGRIAFGPDGNLYVGTGDANNTANAQNPNSLGGKILRMRPDGTVPPGNPFANSVVYSLGHRNVQGLAWDSAGRLYATEFGQNTTDEVNQIVAGGNYGWPTCEGRCTDPRFRNPITTWTTAQASPSGAAIANNTIFVAALRGTRLWLVPLTSGGGAGTPTIELQGTFGRLRTVAVGPDGFLYIATSNRDGRGSPAPTDDRVIRFPPDTAPVNDFALEANPASGSAAPGGSTTTTITTRVVSGSPQTVTFGTTGLPTGVTASFNPPSVTAGGSSTLTLSVAAGTNPGTFPISVTGQGTTLTRSTPYTLTIGGGGGVVYEDTFETATGWTVNAGGTDTATSGLFERGNPEASVYQGQTYQLDATTSGVNCLITGRLFSGGPGNNDLDGGISSVRSPSITLPTGRTLTLSFRYYLAHLNNSSTGDSLRVRVGGTVVFERLGAAVNTPAVWQTATVNLTPFAGQTITIQVEANDGATASLVEAAVDDVRIA